MLRCLIIDDEKHCSDMLYDLLKEYCPQVTVLEQCSSVEKGIIAIDKYKPDLIFLDIEMPHKTGFDLLLQLKEINFEIIFTTAYEQYAIKAFKFSALDFLLKPVLADDLRQAVNKAGNKISLNLQQKRIETLLHNINYMNIDKKIALPTAKGLEFVAISEIVRCESDNNYTVFHLANKSKIMVSKTLGDFEDLLADYHFFRVHQSHLINLRYVKNYVKGEGGMVTMVDDSVVDISRRKKEEFIKSLSTL